MNYPIPPHAPGHVGRAHAVDENDLVDALNVVVQAARADGQTLQDVTAEVLAEDHLLSASQRLLLSEIVAQAWEQIPTVKPETVKPELATVTPIATETRRGPSLLAG